MAEWRSDELLATHFRRHGRCLGCATIDQYDASARETTEVGTQFEYRDPDTGAWGMGWYDGPSQRFTAMNEDGVLILTHFRCPERLCGRHASREHLRMTDRGKIIELHAADSVPPVKEAYRRIARLHYALATADNLTDSLHQRAIDDLMDILEILERSMPPQSGSQADCPSTI
jgi:hypothetical protein